MTTNIDENVRQAIREEIAASQQRQMFDPSAVRDAALILGQVNVVDAIDNLKGQVYDLSNRNGILLGAMRTPGLGAWLDTFTRGNTVWRTRETWERNFGGGLVIEWVSGRVEGDVYIGTTGYSSNRKEGLIARVVYKTPGNSYDSKDEIRFGQEIPDPKRDAWGHWMSEADKEAFEALQQIIDDANDTGD